MNGNVRDGARTLKEESRRGLTEEECREIERDGP